VDGSLMWFVATITLRRFVAASGRRPPHQKPTYAVQQRTSLLDHIINAHEKQHWGTSRPSAFGVFRLMISSTFLDRQRCVGYEVFGFAYNDKTAVQPSAIR